MLTSLLVALERSCLRQHRHPVAFFQALEKEGGWRLFWPTRLAIVLCGLFILPALLFALTGDRLVILATTVAACTFLLVSGAFMIMVSPIAGSQPLQWIAYLLLYHFSLPFLVVVLFCAGAPRTNVGLWLGWYIGLPILLGVSVADACALAVYQSAHKTRANWAYQRPGGPAAELPELILWQRANAIRMGIAALLVSGAGVMVWRYGQAGSIAAMLLLCGAAGCARIEALVLAGLGWPLVRYDLQQNCWRVAYVGRTALWLPTVIVRRTIQSAPSPQAASAMVYALLQEGGLGGVTRQACVHLPEANLQALLLHLSLVEGGAQALRFFQPKLPSTTLRQGAYALCLFACEAAKPLDLQRWLLLLTEQAVNTWAGLPDDLAEVLIAVQAALAQYTLQPVVMQAAAELQRYLQALQTMSPDSVTIFPLPALLSWPFALWVHLEQHRRQLSPTSRLDAQARHR